MYVYRYVIFLILFFLLFKMIFIRRLPHQKKQVSVASDHFISIKIHVIFQILLAKMIYFCRNLFKNPSATNHNCLCHSLCRWNCMHAQMRRKSHCKAHSCICVTVSEYFINVERFTVFLYQQQQIVFYVEPMY